MVGVRLLLLAAAGLVLVPLWNVPAWGSHETCPPERPVRYDFSAGVFVVFSAPTTASGGASSDALAGTASGAWCMQPLTVPPSCWDTGQADVHGIDTEFRALQLQATSFLGTRWGFGENAGATSLGHLGNDAGWGTFIPLGCDATTGQVYVRGEQVRHSFDVNFHLVALPPQGGAVVSDGVATASIDTFLRELLFLPISRPAPPATPYEQTGLPIETRIAAGQNGAGTRLALEQFMCAVLQRDPTDPSYWSACGGAGPRMPDGRVGRLSFDAWVAPFASPAPTAVDSTEVTWDPPDALTAVLVGPWTERNGVWHSTFTVVPSAATPRCNTEDAAAVATRVQMGEFIVRSFGLLQCAP